jgi:hypothetical protein
VLILDSEDGSTSMFPRNVSDHLPDWTASNSTNNAFICRHMDTFENATQVVTKYFAICPFCSETKHDSWLELEN